MADPARTALITGITGQDGSYLAELLLAKGYEVHGLIRRSSSFYTGRIDHLYHDPHESGTRLFLHYADLTDSSSLIGHLHRIKPDEVYNLGAQSHVKVSFEMPEFTADTAAMGTLRMLEAVRDRRLADPLLPGRLVGDVRRGRREPADRNHAVPPAQPVRHRQGLRPLDDRQVPRGLRPARQQRHPVQPRIAAARRDVRHPQGHAAAIARIIAGETDQLYLGNLDARRDWGYAAEYVEAMWRMLQQDDPDDYVIATGEMHSVRELCEVAFALVGLDWERHVRVDERYFRPTEVDQLCGDASKAARVARLAPGDALPRAGPDHARGRPARGRPRPRGAADRRRTSWMTQRLGSIHSLLHAFGVDLVRHPGAMSILARRLALFRAWGVDLVVDVGANSGQYGQSLRSMGYRGAIVSIEPLPEAYDVLQREASRDGGWRAERFALGRSDASAPLYVAANSYSSSLFQATPTHEQAAPDARPVGQVVVTVHRLSDIADDLLGTASRPMLKIDTQGSELDILDGAGDALDRFVGLQVELSLVPMYEGTPLMTEVIDWLEARGFYLCELEPEFADPRTRRLLQVNGFFANRAMARVATEPAAVGA